MSTAIGVFDSAAGAESAVEALRSRDFDEQQIGIVTDERVVRGFRTTRAIVTGGHYDASQAEAGALVSVQAGDERVGEALEILSSSGAVDVENREGEWSQWGATESVHDSEPDEPLTEPDKPEPDPLLDLESNKGGT